MRVDELPDRVAIIGGGTVSCEMAHVLTSFGSSVTVVVRGPAVLREAEQAVSQESTQRLSQRTDLRLNTRVRAARRDGTTWPMPRRAPARTTLPIRAAVHYWRRIASATKPACCSSHC